MKWIAAVLRMVFVTLADLLEAVRPQRREPLKDRTAQR
jgi:hypothetical protein